MYGTEYDYDSVTNLINFLISYNLLFCLYYTGNTLSTYSIYKEW